LEHPTPNSVKGPVEKMRIEGKLFALNPQKPIEGSIEGVEAVTAMYGINTKGKCEYCSPKNRTYKKTGKMPAFISLIFKLNI
jgi:hypothetical protein